MASRPKGQSKREAAAAAAGGKLNYKTGAISKPIAKTTVPKPVASSNRIGIGSNADGTTLYSDGTSGNAYASNVGETAGSVQARFNAQQSGILPPAPKASSNKSNSSNSSSRSKASAYVSGGGISSGSNQNFSPSNQQEGESLVPAPAGRNGASVGNGGGEGFWGKFLNNIATQRNPQLVSDIFGIPSANASDNQSMAFPVSDEILAGLGDGGVFKSNDNPSSPGPAQPFSPVQSGGSSSIFQNSPSNGSGGSSSQYGSSQGAPSDPTSVDIASAQKAQNLPSPNDVTSPPTPDVPLKGSGQSRGAGLYSNGAALTNNPAEDDYIKQLRKAYSSNGGEKYIRQQFEELIKQLDPTYAQLTKEGTDTLNNQLLTDNTKLASVMNANNTGDSEQRSQLLAGQQRDTQSALGTFLAKLATAKAGDVSQYKSKLNESLASNAEKQQTNTQRLMEQIRLHQNDLADRNYKNASLAGKGANGVQSNDITLLQTGLKSRAGQDGYVSPQDYAQAQALFAQQYPGKASSFSSLFPVHQFISPDEYKRIYGSAQQPLEINFGAYNGQ